MAEYEYIDFGCPDGAILGRTTSEKIAFYGSTPVSQLTGSTQAAVAVSTVTTAATSTSPYGFATSTQADNLAATVVNCRTLVNQLRSDLVSLGLIKGSA